MKKNPIKFWMYDRVMNPIWIQIRGGIEGPAGIQIYDRIKDPVEQRVWVRVYDRIVDQVFEEINR